MSDAEPMSEPTKAIEPKVAVQVEWAKRDPRKLLPLRPTPPATFRRPAALDGLRVVQAFRPDKED